jgi:glycerol transport system permease protein
MTRNGNNAWYYLLPTALFLIAMGFAPLMTVINYSVQDSFAGDQYFWVGTQWYEQMFRSLAFWQTLGRTILFSFLTLTIQIFLGIFIARKLYLSGKFDQFFIAIFALPLLIPWIVVGFLWRHAVNADVGLIGATASYFGIDIDLNSVVWVWGTIIVMDVWHWTSLTVILCYAGYVSIPKQYFFAAKIDGAQEWATFRYIELPRLKNVLTISLLLRLADSLMIYTEPLMISRGGPHVSSTFLSQELIKTAMQEFNLGEAGALSVFYLLLMISVAWVFYKSIRGANV